MEQAAEYIFYKNIPRELEFEEWDGKISSDFDEQGTGNNEQ